MKTYSVIKAEIAKLEKQAEAARKAEVAGVVAKIKTAIAAYDLTADDLGFSRSAAKGPKASKAKGKKKLTVGVAKYRDPKTGKTWTGRGKPPAWIAGAKNRDPFLIDGQTTGATPAASGKRSAKRASNGSASAAAAPKAARKPGKKVTGKRRKSQPATVKTPAVQIESGAAAA